MPNTTRVRIAVAWDGSRWWLANGYYNATDAELIAELTENIGARKVGGVRFVEADIDMDPRPIRGEVTGGDDGVTEGRPR